MTFSKKYLVLIFSLVLILSTISMVAAQECNTFCKILNFITGGATCPGCISGNAVGVQSETCPDGMVSYWRGNGDTSDAKGINNGAAVGELGYTDGKVGQAFNLDGNSYIDITTNSFPFENSPRTVEAWVNLGSDCSRYMIPLQYGSAGYAQQFNLYISCQDNGIQFNGYNFVYGISNSFSPNAWYHIAETFDGITMKFYVNNQLIGQSTVTTWPSPIPLNNMATTSGGEHFIGHVGWWGMTSSGKIDELAIYNRVLTDVEITDHYNNGAGKDYCAAVEEPACPDGMVSYWKGEDNANDEKGTNNGVVNGGTTYIPGKVGNAFKFDGSSGYVDLGNDASLSLSDELSMEAWVKLDNCASNPSFMGKIDSGSGKGYALFIDGGCHLFNIEYFTNGGASMINQGYTNPGLTPGVWYYVVGTYGSNGAAKLYIDGVDVTQTIVAGSGTIKPTSFNSFLGRDSLSYFPGALDEVAVYNRVLTQAEITDHYNAGNGKSYCAAAPVEETCPAGMVSYYKAEGNANDVKGINNGQTQGGVTYVDGKVGKAFLFDGSTGYVDVNSPINFADEMTMEAWVNYHTSGPILADLNLCPGCTAQNGAGYELSPGYHLYYTSNSPGYLQFGTPMTADSWHYMVSTYKNGDRAKLYIDGVIVSDLSVAGLGGIYPSSLNLNIGRAQSVWSSYFGGMIDEVAIYNRVLTDAEITDHYNNGDGKSYCAAAQGPVCGNAQIESGEACDSNSETCMLGNGYLGQQVCNTVCNGWNGCVLTEYCGDNVVNGPETCDDGNAASGDGCSETCDVETQSTCPSSMVSYWKAEGNANDEKGTNNGNVIGTVLYSPGRNNVGEAFNFDGNGAGVVKVSESSSLLSSVSGPYTYTMWVYPRTYTTTWPSIFSIGDSTPGYSGLAIYMDRNNNYLVALGDNEAGGSWDNWVTTDLLPTNKWSFVTITNDGNNFIYYVDGIQKGIDNSASFVNWNSASWLEKNLYIGERRAGQGAYDAYFDGMIDDFAIYNTVLSANEVSGLYTKSNSGQGYCESPVEPTCPTGLVSYWKGENNANDAKGTNNGNIVGGVNYAAGKIGNAFSLDGSDDYINLGDTNLFENWDEFTIDGWVYSTDASIERMIIANLYTEYPNGMQFALLAPNNLNHFGIYLPSGGINTQTSLSVPLNQWVYFAAVKTPTEITYYINSNKNSIPGNYNVMPADNSPTYIGARPYSGNLNPFSGKIDELAVYNRALTDAEIADHYNGGLGKSLCAASSATCSDGVKNQNEIDVDCGGVCGKCNVGQICTTNTDCLTNLCSISNICIAGSPGLPACETNDVNGDGNVNVLDAIVINRMAAMLPWHTTGPAGCEQIYIESD